MPTLLVTGATGFLGYHVVKRLNASGVRPRVLERPDANIGILESVDVERAAGHLDEPASLRAACDGVDQVLHLAYKVSLEGGDALAAEMRRVNVDGTVELLRSAAAAGVRRAVVVGSALAVGVNREPAPLDERASWSQHALDLSYATIRRDAEIAALAEARPGFDVISVCPAFTFGPDDPVGAPANKLLERLVSGKLPVSLQLAFSCTDVRDFADGMVRAAERGRSGERYLLTGENVTADALLQRAAAIAGVRAPRWKPPTFLAHGGIGALELVSRLLGRSAPLTRDVLQVVGQRCGELQAAAVARVGERQPRRVQERPLEAADGSKVTRHAPADAAV